MKSKLLLVLVAAIATGASGCGSSPASRIPFPSGPLVPSINSVNPSAAVAGAPGFTLIVFGGNFVAGSVVRWNGSDRPTTITPDVYINGTGYVVAANTATAQIPSSDIAEAGTAEITVFSPAPGGGTSNTVTFTIAAHGLYPNSVAVDPAGKFAYVTISDSDNVLTYAINTDGTLAFKGTIAAGSNPVSIAVHRSGKFAYVANCCSVSMYTIDATTGALAPNGEINGGGTTVVVDPSGKFAYVANLANGNVANGNISMYTIDATTGALTSGGTIAARTGPVSMAVDPSGKFAYVANVGADTDYDHYPGSVSMYTIDTTTGALMPNGEINETSTTMSPSSVAVDPSDKFAYVANYNSHSISMYSIDTTTGKLTSIGTVDAAGYVLSLAVHPSGNFAYATGLSLSNISRGLVSAYTMNATTGVLATNGTAPAEQSPRSIAIAPSGKFAYVTNSDSHSISMYTIDAATGTLTLIETTGT